MRQQTRSADRHPSSTGLSVGDNSSPIGYHATDMTEFPMANAVVYTWDDVRPENGDGVSRRLIPGDGASLKMVSIKAGTTADRHSHPHEQFVQVLEGSGYLECEIGTIALKPGTIIHFAPDTWHSAVFETDTVLVEVNLRPAG